MMNAISLEPKQISLFASFVDKKNTSYEIVASIIDFNTKSNCRAHPINRIAKSGIFNPLSKWTIFLFDRYQRFTATSSTKYLKANNRATDTINPKINMALRFECCTAKMINNFIYLHFLRNIFRHNLNN